MQVLLKEYAETQILNFDFISLNDKTDIYLNAQHNFHLLCMLYKNSTTE